MATARAKHPIPSRTRKLRAVAPMVLRLKTWESRSPPNLTRNTPVSLRTLQGSLGRRNNIPPPKPKTNAGWSSPVARQAHNLKVVGSNPTPATKSPKHIKRLAGGIPLPQAVRAFTSTPHQHRTRKIAFACTRTHRQALARIRGHRTRLVTALHGV